MSGTGLLSSVTIIKNPMVYMVYLSKSLKLIQVFVNHMIKYKMPVIDINWKLSFKYKR